MRQGSRFAAVAFALLLAGCASSGGRSGDRAAVLDDARAHPENRLADAVACELTLASRSGEFPFAPFFAGLLDVPEAEGSRSEEHTSELQSLMRISYAVFCLKKKNTTQ